MMSLRDEIRYAAQICSGRIAKNAHKDLAHPRLCLRKMRLKSGKVRNIRSTSEQHRQLPAGGLWLERRSDTQPQNLPEVLVEPNSSAQHLRILRREQAEPSCFIEHTGGRGIENVRHCTGVC